MSMYSVFQLTCDGAACDDVVDSILSKSAARATARKSGWRIGRGGVPDLCPSCAAGEASRAHIVRWIGGTDDD